MIHLQDTDKMPFGTHKDVQMQDVPASYLHWLWVQGASQKTKVDRVADYIQRNLTGLKLEHPDGIW